MANDASSFGQLQRSGVQTVRRLITGGPKKKKKGKKLRASRIRESYRHAFVEQGQDQGNGKKKNRVYLCTIIEEGLGNSKDKNYYSAEALKSGAKVFEGAKAYADHPDAITEKTLPERSMKDLVGWYSNCTTDVNPATGKARLQAKIHFFPSAKWLTTMIDTVLTDPTAKNLFGISINAVGRTRPQVMNGEEVNYVEEFQRVDSADVVTEPAARGKFEKMLESRRSVASAHPGKVSKVMRNTSRRTREAAALGPEKLKEVADSLVSAYNSDNPDEMKQSMFEAAQQLHAATAISGKGPGQVNEEQYSNINPSGGRESMSRKTRMRVKASTGKRSFRRGKTLRAADGTGPDNENVGEPSPSDIEDHLESAREADVEDKEGKTDVGMADEFGGSKHYAKEARGRGRRAIAQEGFEDEGFEDEDEGFEDEDENMGAGMGGGMPGASVGAPAGGGAPGSSRTVASGEAGDGDDDQDDDDDDLGEMDEAFEDEGMEDEGMEDEGMEDEGFEDEVESSMRPGVIAEARDRMPRRRPMLASRGRVRGREASFSGGLGKHGHSALPEQGDPTRGYDPPDQGYGKVDSSTSGVGKSYKIKTSRFAHNKLARKAVKEANRRIEVLEEAVRRLRESRNAAERKNLRYKGILSFIDSKKNAERIIREAIRKDVLPEEMLQSRTLRESLWGMSPREQYLEIRRTAMLLESAQEGTLSRLQESVEGSGARGSVASYLRTAGAENSELVDGFANAGIPMKREE